MNFILGLDYVFVFSLGRTDLLFPFSLSSVRRCSFVRTGPSSFCLLLSEVELCSDKALIFLLPLVRRRSMFGQGLPLFALSCPKANHVQTRSSSFCILLSEGDLCSDRTLIFLPSLVRRRSMFGQKLLLFTFYCPKVTRVRTGLLFFSLFLSEGHPCSDRTLIFLLSPVRMSPAFSSS